MPKPGLFSRFVRFFTVRPCPSAVFQLTSSTLSGIRVATKEREVREVSVVPLLPGQVEPHFDRKNLADAKALTAVLKEMLTRLHGGGKWAACLLPESCFKIFILPFDALPASAAERENLIRWRIKKQMPVVPDDVRLSYAVVSSGGALRVVLALARKAVIQEYEALFASARLPVGAVTVPSLSLLNLVEREREEDLLVVNIEEDSLSLAAVSPSDLTLYRHKALGAASGRSIENIAVEIENTVHFLADREKREVRSLWLHAAAPETGAEVVAAVGARFDGAVRMIDSPRLARFAPAERAVLAPLIGQIP